MAKIKLIRQPTVANQQMSYEFDTLGFVFLVKNFTDDSVLIWLDDNCSDEEKILIEANGFQEIEVNRGNRSVINGSKVVNIIPSETNSIGVEVQMCEY